MHSIGCSTQSSPSVKSQKTIIPPMHRNLQKCQYAAECFLRVLSTMAIIKQVLDAFLSKKLSPFRQCRYYCNRKVKLTTSDSTFIGHLFRNLAICSRKQAEIGHTLFLILHTITLYQNFNFRNFQYFSSFFLTDIANLKLLVELNKNTFETIMSMNQN